MYVSPLCRVKTKTSSTAQCRVPANEDLTPSAAVRVLPEEFSYDNIIDNYGSRAQTSSWRTFRFLTFSFTPLWSAQAI